MCGQIFYDKISTKQPLLSSSVKCEHFFDALKFDMWVMMTEVCQDYFPTKVLVWVGKLKAVQNPIGHCKITEGAIEAFPLTDFNQGHFSCLKTQLKSLL